MVIAGIKVAIKVHSNTLPFFGTLETGRLIQILTKYNLGRVISSKNSTEQEGSFRRPFGYIIYCYHALVFTPRFSCICHHLILRNFFKIFPFKIQDAELILSFTTAQPPRFKVLFLSENVIRVMICRIILAFGIR